jgi:hypothetical protein
MLALSTIGTQGAIAGARPGKPSPGPTAAHVRAALRRAERSADLWATINICNTAQYPDDIGIRGQLPGLGFATRISMNVSVEYYSIKTKHFEPTGASELVDLGRATTGVHQGGVRFPFKAPAAGQSYELRGVITFEWKRGNKLLGRMLRHTTHGHRNVDFSDPPGFSAGTCTISAPP